MSVTRGIPDAPGNITRTVADFERQLGSWEGTALRRYQQTYTSIIGRLADDLGQVERMIASKIAAGEDIPVSWLHKQQRYKSLIIQADREFTNFGGDVLNDIGEMQHRAVRLAERSAVSMLEAALPKYQTLVGPFNKLPENALVQLSGQLHQDSPLAGVLQRYGDEGAEIIDQELTSGLAKGIPPTHITKKIIERLDMLPYKAALIARTEMYRSYREANRFVYDANKAIVDAWTWFAHVGPNTCAACLGMHGEEFPTDTPMGSHPNCRCTLLPKTKSWEDLGFPGVKDQKFNIGNPEKFLKEAPEHVQKKAFGNLGLWKEWKKGRIKLKDTVRRVDSPNWGTNRTIGSRQYALDNAARRKAAESAARRQLAAEKAGTAGPRWLTEAQRLRTQGAGGLSERDIRDLGSLLRKQIDDDTATALGGRTVDDLAREKFELEQEIAELSRNKKRGFDLIDAIDEDVRQFGGTAEQARLRQETLDRIRADAQIQIEKQYRLDKIVQQDMNMFGHAERREAVLNVLRQIEPEYGTQRLALDWVGSPTEAIDALQDATKYFPKKWVDEMNTWAEGQKAQTSLVPRAQFGRTYIDEAGNEAYDGFHVWVNRTTNLADRRASATHELSHFREASSQTLVRLEKEFYARRTAGEFPEHMGAGFNPNEFSRLDKFIHPYIGKDYRGYAYEVTSVGMETLFETRLGLNIADDPEFYDFILGILATGA